MRYSDTVSLHSSAMLQHAPVRFVFFSFFFCCSSVLALLLHTALINLISLLYKSNKLYDIPSAVNENGSELECKCSLCAIMENDIFKMNLKLTSSVLMIASQTVNSVQYIRTMKHELLCSDVFCSEYRKNNRWMHFK